jgi:hypothetical protein
MPYHRLARLECKAAFAHLRECGQRSFRVPQLLTVRWIGRLRQPDDRRRGPRRTLVGPAHGRKRTSCTRADRGRCTSPHRGDRPHPVECQIRTAPETDVEGYTASAAWFERHARMARPVTRGPVKRNVTAAHGRRGRDVSGAGLTGNHGHPAALPAAPPDRAVGAHPDAATARARRANQAPEGARDRIGREAGSAQHRSHS